MRCEQLYLSCVSGAPGKFCGIEGVGSLRAADWPIDDIAGDGSGSDSESDSASDSDLKPVYHCIPRRSSPGRSGLGARRCSRSRES
ncbi:hypothetical protein VTK56DRAFT_10103 [Thermocarpiscus australiensis]